AAGCSINSRSLHALERSCVLALENARKKVASAERGCERPTGDLLSAATEQDDLQSFEDDLQIEHGGNVFDIIEIVVKLFDRVLFTVSVRVGDLRPAGDSGLHGESKMIIRDLLFEFGNKKRPLGSRADKTHLSLQHIHHLR